MTAIGDRPFVRNVVVILLILLAVPSWALPLDLEFKQAIRRGDHQQVEQMLSSGYDPLSRDVNGDTAAHVAAAAGQRQMLAKFLDLGVPVNSLNHQDHSLLYEAAVADSPDCCRLLLERGASTDGFGVCWSPFRASLIWGRSKAALVLLEAGVDPHAPLSDEGDTPLMVAAGRGPVAVTRALLEAGAEPARLDKEGRSALHYAARGGEAESIKVLLKNGLKPLQADNAGLTPLELAYRSGSSESADLLLEKAAPQGALPATVFHGSLEQVRNLLRRGARPEADGFPYLVTAARRADLGSKMAQLLLEAGAGWESSREALQVACTEENTEMVRLLLDRGVDPNQPDRRGDYPLLVACGNGNLELVKLLLESGADPKKVGPGQVGALERIRQNMSRLEGRIEHLGRFRCLHPELRPTQARLHRLMTNFAPIQKLLGARE